MFKTIYNRIRLLMLRHKEPYMLYHNLLGFWPDDIHLYEQACLHRSSSICEQGRRINNERLEFLGDSVLNCVIGQALFLRDSHFNEGSLSRVRANLVCQDAL